MLMSSTRGPLCSHFGLQTCLADVAPPRQAGGRGQVRDEEHEEEHQRRDSDGDVDSWSPPEVGGRCRSFPRWGKERCMP